MYEALEELEVSFLLLYHYHKTLIQKIASVLCLKCDRYWFSGSDNINNVMLLISISPLSYNLGLPYLLHLLMSSQTCVTWPWSHFHGFVISSISQLPYNLASHIDDRRYMFIFMVYLVYFLEREKCLTNDLHEQARHKSVSRLVYREGINVIFI